MTPDLDLEAIADLDLDGALADDPDCPPLPDDPFFGATDAEIAAAARSAGPGSTPEQWGFELSRLVRAKKARQSFYPGVLAGDDEQRQRRGPPGTECPPVPTAPPAPPTLEDRVRVIEKFLARSQKIGDRWHDLREEITHLVHERILYLEQRLELESRLSTKVASLLSRISNRVAAFGYRRSNLIPQEDAAPASVGHGSLG